jgi:hypothetical protein
MYTCWFLDSPSDRQKSALYRDLIGHRFVCEGGYSLLSVDLDQRSDAPRAVLSGCPSERSNGPPARQ